jgi:hypothetical protein
MDEQENPYAPLAFIIVLLFTLLMRGSVALMRD